jgi:exonuclease VII small subunit
MKEAQLKVQQDNNKLSEFYDGFKKEKEDSEAKARWYEEKGREIKEVQKRIDKGNLPLEELVPKLEKTAEQSEADLKAKKAEVKKMTENKEI